MVNCSKFNAGLTVCGSNDGITRVAIILTESPYFLSLNMIRYISGYCIEKEKKREHENQKETEKIGWLVQYFNNGRRPNTLIKY